MTLPQHPVEALQRNHARRRDSAVVVAADPARTVLELQPANYGVGTLPRLTRPRDAPGRKAKPACAGLVGDMPLLLVHGHVEGLLRSEVH